MKAHEIARLADGILVGDGDVEITHAADIGTANADSLSFSTSLEHVETLAGCVIVKQGSTQTAKAIVEVSDPRLAFSIACEILHPPKRSHAIHPTAVIADSAKIGDRATIGPNAVIGEEVAVGDDCYIAANVVIENGCTVGDRVTLHAGVVVGTDGFGFARDKDRYVKFPQIGTVVIENDVEVGANSTIDRGALGETRIGEGTKIDNLVQIAHNVSIGKRVVIAAQTGISGSTVIEDDCVIGGQVGMGDHARVQSGAVIGSQAGVLPGKIVRPGVWWGTPVQPLDEYKRQNAMVKGLARLRDEVKELKKRLS
ncbi:MAG TPA: UDP-3-O-(3-hydroxymyristoyl)glucosamine N-acyltransferase [Pyrinomonadaceae bacterium]|nr:UDP-3-O-(3-hydroxymyristoyl)glucosamine N-acyltransferase [Pyrinomonadaceae bacterium]